jgi:hypothetical protein
MTEYAPTTQTGSTSEQVKDQVTEKAQVAQDRARGATEQARSRLRDQVDQRSTQAGERLSGTAADVRSVADELRRQGKDTPARLAEQLAGQTDRAADYLKGASGERILRDVEDLARGNPWAVAAGGLVLGFAASRFLKASSRRRYQQAKAGYPDRLEERAAQPAAQPYRSAEPPPLTETEPLPATGVPVVGTYDPAASTETTRVPADPEQRAPRAE